MPNLDKIARDRLEAEIQELKQKLKESESEKTSLHDSISREAEADLMNSFDSADLFSLRINLKGEILSCNESACEILGLPTEAIIYQHFEQFILTENFEPPISFEDILLNGLMEGSQNAKVVSRKGGELPIHYGVLVVRNSEDEIIGATIFGEDLVERRAKDIALVENEKQFRTIFESIQDIYFRSDLKGRLKLLSPSVVELTGYDVEGLLGKNVADYYLYNHKTKDLLRKLIINKSVRNFEASVVKKNGDIISCLCNVRLIYDEGNRPIEIEGVARDISELKRTNLELLRSKEVAEKSLEVKDKFLANMSHEIRTPMNGIIGTMDLLVGTNLSNEQRKYIQTVKKSSETLLTILNDILDLSKIEAGKMILKKRSISIYGIFDKVLGLFEQQAEQQGIRLQYDIAKTVPAFVMADETRLLQVLSNLISNAIKFTSGAGSIMFYTQVISDADDVLTIKVDVTDTGIGISRENLHQLFENFSQLDDSSTKSFGGTGLGLVISRQLCHLMNGDIGVSSAPGMGSTFWFTFETAVASEEVLEEQEKAPFESLVDFDTPPKLLLVDDNKINRDVASQILEKSGFEVSQAASGTVALECVLSQSFDVILMDIQMPEMDGIEALHEIRKKLGKDSPPILAMTAYSMEDDKAKYIAEGFNDYIAKPIKAIDLISVASRWVRKQHSSLHINEVDVNQSSRVINSDVILSLSKYTDEKSVRQIYKDFNLEASEQLESIGQQINAEKYNGALEELHTLKGTAGTLGVECLAEQARLMEEAIKANNLTILAGEIDTLKAHYGDFQEMFKKMFN